MTVKRYQLSGDRMFQAEEGAWVWYADYSAEVAALKEQLRTERATQARLITAHQAEVAALRERLARAEGVLRVIAGTDYRGNRSTEAMAAQAYFDAAIKDKP